jgi:hypothetical protein
MRDEDRQNALADVTELARLLHALRGLSDEVETLLADAMKIAHGTGLSQAVIAEAVAGSPGRVSQVIKTGEASMTQTQLHDHVFKISEWPGDALRPHRATFTGRMTMPPYARRRSNLTPNDASSRGVAESGLVRQNQSEEAEKMNTATVSYSYYRVLAEAAAQREGYLSARRVIAGKTFHQSNDFFGTILCETWLIDPNLIGNIGGAYVRTLRSECAAEDVTPPTVDEVLETIPRAINDERFPSVDVDALMRALARDVPAIAG